MNKNQGFSAGFSFWYYGGFSSGAVRRRNYGTSDTRNEDLIRRNWQDYDLSEQ